MKVCIDAREFKPHRQTGIARYLEALLQPLAQESDFELSLVSDTPEAVPPAIRHLPTHPLRSSPTWRQDGLEIPALLRALRPDVFFSPYYKTQLRGRFKRVTAVHDILFLRRTDEPAWRRFLIREYLRLSSRRADLILTDSLFTRRDLLELLPGMEQKTHLLYPGLTEFWSQPATPDEVAKARHMFPDARPFALYVGNFKPHKNVDRLILGFLTYRAAHPDTPLGLLLVGGDSASAPSIQRLIIENGDAVRVQPHATDKELKAFYTAAQWLITASSYEGFGYPLVEAMSCNCPILCAQNTSLTEIAGEAVLPIPMLSVEGIATTLATALVLPPQNRAALIDAGRARLPAFLNTQMAKSFAVLLRQLEPTKL